MRCVLAIVTAELLELELLRHGLAILGRRVVPTFALGALQRDDFSTALGHVSLRFETSNSLLLLPRHRDARTTTLV